MHTLSMSRCGEFVVWGLLSVPSSHHHQMHSTNDKTQTGHAFSLFLDKGATEWTLIQSWGEYFFVFYVETARFRQ